MVQSHCMTRMVPRINATKFDSPYAMCLIAFVDYFLALLCTIYIQYNSCGLFEPRSGRIDRCFT